MDEITSKAKTSVDSKSGENLEKAPNLAFSPPNNEGDKCSICQDTELFKDMYALPCAHKFHELCINEWLKKKQVCPICRFRVGNASNAHDEGLGDGDAFDSFNDDVVVLDPPSYESFSWHIQYVNSDSEEEEESFISPMQGMFESLSGGESQDSSDEGLEISIAANAGNVLSSGDNESDSGDSQADSDRYVSESDEEQETSASENEPTVSELYDGSETTESDEEPDTSESNDEPDSEQETSGNYESYISEPDTSDADDEQEPSGSLYEPEISESDSETDGSLEENESDEQQESSESDGVQESSESESYESCDESYYDSDTD